MRPVPPNLRRLFPRKVALLILGVLLAVFFAALPQYLHEIQSPLWPTASGTITVSQVRKGYMHPMGANLEGYVPDVHYTYNVRGIDFEGTRIDFHLQQHLQLEENAERWVKMYPTGKVVSVYYDPKDADNAVLVPGIQSEQRGLFYVTIGFIVSICLAFVLVFLYYDKAAVSEKTN